MRMTTTYKAEQAMLHICSIQPIELPVMVSKETTTSSILKSCLNPCSPIPS